MFLLGHGFRHTVQVVRSGTTRSPRRLASRIAIPFAPPPFPVVEQCPSPTCQCRELPSGLDIEREQNISGSMATYAEQVLISTGRADWKSKIEDEEDAVFVRQLKKYLTRGGKYVDPYHNVMITNSSFPPSQHPHRHIERPSQEPDVLQENVTSAPPASAYLLPSFRYIPSIPTSDSSVEAFIKAFVLPKKLHRSYDSLTCEQQNTLLREPAGQSLFTGARPINEILVLICGHGGRDERCGKLGPILLDEFEDQLRRQSVTILEGAPAENDGSDNNRPTARIGMISHIGGHKWAGNVIIYVPPALTRNALSGKGIWYGRVAPEHVEGIVAKTIMEGQVIKELFRGGIDRSGEILRL